MTWTYSSTALSTDLAKVRLQIGDTDTNDQLMTDEEINRYLDVETNLTLAAAKCCEALEAKYARQFSFGADGANYNLDQKMKHFGDLAIKLRKLAVATDSEIVAITRVDGYSDDIDSQDVTVSSGQDWDVGRWTEFV